MKLLCCFVSFLSILSSSSSSVAPSVNSTCCTCWSVPFALSILKPSRRRRISCRRFWEVWRAVGVSRFPQNRTRGFCPQVGCCGSTLVGIFLRVSFSYMSSRRAADFQSLSPDGLSVSIPPRRAVCWTSLSRGGGPPTGLAVLSSPGSRSTLPMPSPTVPSMFFRRATE